MADEKEPEADDPELEGAAAEKPKLKLSVPMIVAIANSLAVIAALGLLVYTKVLYKKPVIDEGTELKKRQEELTKPAAIAERMVVPFDQLRVNIASTSDKSHYAIVAFAVECRDAGVADDVKRKRDLFLDKIIDSLGRRQMTELNTVQGKLILKSELMRRFNELTQPAAITDIFFSTFILQ